MTDIDVCENSIFIADFTFHVVRGEKYEYAGKLYRSLSGVAKAITNTNWNGNEFFGIRKR